MGFDRSNFGATSVQTLKEQEETQASLRPSNSGNNTRVGYHDVDEGTNVFRMAPFHPDGEGKSFVEAKTVSFLTLVVDKRDDDGKVIEGEKEAKRRPVFNARVHGIDDGGEPLAIDLVETYLGLLKKNLQEEFQDDEAGYKKEWAKATGFKSKDSMKPQDSWVMYAWKWIKDATVEAGGYWKFGKLEVKSSIRGQMNDIAARLDEAGDVLNVDPFSHPDEGLPVKIVKNSNNEPSKFYQVDFDKKTVKVRGGFEEKIEAVPLTDEQLEELLEQPTLHSLFREQYTRSTFEQEIEGLKAFDDKFKFGVCDTEEFELAVQYLSDNVQDDKEEEEEAAEETQEKAAPAPAAKKTVTKKAAPAKEAPAAEEQEEESGVVVAEESEEEMQAQLAALKQKLGVKD